MYKKITIITLILLACSVFSYAQKEQNKDRKARLEQHKIAYLSAELDMSTDQAQRFWPVYNKYQALNKENRMEHLGGKKDIADLSESEAQKYIAMSFEEEERKLQWKKDFVNELKDVLENKQILKLLNAEKKFRKEILEKYKKRRKMGMKKKR